MLLDTNIVIELFKGNLRVSAFFREQNVLSVCSVSVMELYYGALDKRELNSIQQALRAFLIVHIDEEISAEAVALIAKYAKSHGLAIPDSIIAATAIIKQMPLCTLNLKDFRYIAGLELATI